VAIIEYEMDEHAAVLTMKTMMNKEILDLQNAEDEGRI
jgi:hypothetical protein